MVLNSGKKSSEMVLLFITVHLINGSQVQIVSANRPPVPPVTASILPTGLPAISKESFHHSPHLSANPVVSSFFFPLPPVMDIRAEFLKMTGQKLPASESYMGGSTNISLTLWDEIISNATARNVKPTAAYADQSRRPSRYHGVFTAYQGRLTHFFKP